MFFGANDGGKGVYFLGIGGVSMSALAECLSRRGIPVRGSDDCAGIFTEKLQAEGIPVTIGREDEIREDTVVYTGAIGEGHPLYDAAKGAGKRLITRAELLGHIAGEYPCVLSVAGCHGKTTTTCMLSHIFHGNGVSFTAHIGGEDLDLGNFYGGTGDIFVTEACEFQRSFLSLKSTVAVILNCDLDHSDCYRDEEDLMRAYAQFASQAEKVVVNADDVRARTLPHALDFGLYAGTVRAEKLRSTGERYAFTIMEAGMPVVRVCLNAVGKVHVYNALAAYCAARLCGFSGEEIKRGLECFRGVKRRFEHIGTFDGVPVICDYAHHPREIAATLKTAERITMGTVRLVFQPHTYTRTRDFLDDFIEVLRHAEAPIIYRTYSAREPYDYAGSAVRLASLIPGARYVQNPARLVCQLRANLSEKDLILVLGAGDIYSVAQGIADR